MFLKKDRGKRVSHAVDSIKIKNNGLATDIRFTLCLKHVDLTEMYTAKKTRLKRDPECSQ